MSSAPGRIALALWLALCLTAGCAATEDRQGQADRDALCAVLDTDKDGRITKEEFMAKTNDKAKGLEVFEKCDTDKKGYLAYDEIWSRRIMLPPELIITTPPLVQPVQPLRYNDWSVLEGSWFPWGTDLVGRKRQPPSPRA